MKRCHLKNSQNASRKPSLDEACANALRYQQSGRLDEAAALFRQILAQDGRHPDALLYSGVLESQRGNHAAAAKLIRKALSVGGPSPVAFTNLGIVLAQLGRSGEALECYRQAVALAPRSAEFRYRLGVALCATATAEGVQHLMEAVLHAPAEPRYQRAFADALEGVRFTSDDPRSRPVIQRAIDEVWGDPDRLVGAALSVLRASPHIAELLDATAGCPDGVDPVALWRRSEIDRLAGDGLFRAVAVSAPIDDIDMERLIRVLRLSACHALRAAEQFSADRVALLVTLARQCYLTEYVHAVEPAEAEVMEALIKRIEQDLADNQLVTPASLALVAAYRPLAEIAGVDRILANASDSLATLIAQQVAAPAEERRLAGSIPQITPITGAATLEVRDQYEANPYPRWERCAATVPAQTIQAAVKTLFPHHVAAVPDAGAGQSILIAGCGTGRHAIGVAQRFPDAQIHAIDLSLASLAYAKRKTTDMGITNVTYAQADIMELTHADARLPAQGFDLVESVGVLHHLADPLAGWAILAKLVTPGGYMKIGLYSEVARADVVAARAFADQQGIEATPNGIRALRQAITALPEENAIKKVTTFSDFYAMSDCRDLLFHVLEHRYSLPDIAANLRALHLKFIGFEGLNENAVAAYRKRFPKDRLGIDIDTWHRFEVENPDTFRGMYNFWCQRRNG
ncbi:tetratricopeptide repeat protein [Azospirillum brasilense]|uniref:methyltransferase domain-containing protein n=1 Tax=Azospirillum argentinense TaxID=2970906 RepID=UPI00190B034F|nr:methyltransferase domain-containing protein [Azospirillum argentinense]MBK3798463.1 tetratricopeptide repeat protein [Azospirillum argentinense]